MNATSQVIQPALLFYRHLQMSLTQALNSTVQDYEAKIILSQDCTEELNYHEQMERESIIEEENRLDNRVRCTDL